MRLRDLSLGNRLFLLALAGILPLAAMSGVGLFGLVWQQRTQAEQSGQELTRALAIGIESELQRSLSVLEALGSSSVLDGDNPETFRLAASRLNQTQGHWLTLILAEPSGNVLVNTNIMPGTALPPLAERASFDQAVRSQKPVVGTLARGMRGAWAIPLRVPAVRDGKLRYIVTGVVAPQSILDVVRRQHVPDDWVISVFDAKGMRVARSRGHDKYLGTPASPSLQRLMAGGAMEGHGEVEALEGDAVYTTFTRLPDSGWAVAIGIPVEAINAAGHRSLAAYGGGILFSLLLGLLGALLLARSINRPIGALRAAAQALGRGAPFTLEPSELAEIDEVADALLAAQAQHADHEAERELLLSDSQAAHQLAERANRVKDHFLAMLGHELRNPLAPIVSALDIMNARHAEYHVAERRVIERQVAHLTRLVDDLLDIARISGGKLALRRARIDLNGVIARTLELTAPLLARRIHPPMVALAPAPLYVYGDAVRLAQVFTNLLSNAAKFTPDDGQIRVSVRAAGAMAEVRIDDSGCGIAPELLAHIFEMFTQGEQPIDRRGGGLGLGLAIVKNLVDLHDGSVRADSAGVGCGASFTVRLPLRLPSPDDGGAAAPPAISASGQGKRVLVVDDNMDAAEMLASLLGQTSAYEVRIAANAQAALAMLDSYVPDVALLDIGLPGMDGYELAQRLRADPRCPGLRLVALTGYGTERDRERARACGFDAHCVKPVALEQLLAALEA
ncbi:MAG: ATP-binding protein [Pseudomonadota bacterium]